jgi:hypothetical protein
VPHEALLLLLEQLPAYFRAAAAGRPMQLPLPLLNVLFPGVTCLLPGGVTSGVQMLAEKQHMQKHSRSHGQQQEQDKNNHKAQSTSRQPSALFDTPSSAVFLDRRCSRPANSSQQQQRQQCVLPPLPETVSGYHCEPLSAAEAGAAAAVGGVCIGALACTGPWLEGSTNMAPLLEVLELNSIPTQQQQQQQQGDATGVRWLPDACPAVVLQSLHAAATAALQHQTELAIQTAGRVKVRGLHDCCDSCTGQLCRAQDTKCMIQGTLCIQILRRMQDMLA